MLLATGAAKDFHAASYVIDAGIVAALHVDKLPPAVADAHASAGCFAAPGRFLLSMGQVAGMALGLLTALATRITIGSVLASGWQRIRHGNTSGCWYFR